MRLPSNAALAVLAAVALVATAGCLTGPLGAGTDATDSTDSTGADTSEPDTERTTNDDRHSSDTGSSDGTSERNDVRVWDADPGDAPDLAADLPDPVACDGAWVSYWGTGQEGMLWDEDGQLRVGWTVPGNQSMLFVGFENETAVGYDHVQYEQSVTADGAGVPVDDDSGTGRYAVVAMLDVNGNGKYDPGTDRPCSDDERGIETTGWLWVDWDADD
ncbi:hypothetical protein G9C85_02230 [Halorubellus sp. JP-L1]|uniref:hypothetical protein n=1 Tax=Halorubellus sp. JP-L1 TaxID=2715753 RepID=UPI0014086AEA|nr:hypothetical protein [Halorubellus sp. JP-L1]NHN40454.1 hypothetical protein [Halorubellus sp. JP-L1]